uniref:Uncharacterized protein n=1 Tax=Arundo donax TaxID=35708 RepID=A0A0A9FCY1_ARUDO
MHCESLSSAISSFPVHSCHTSGAALPYSFLCSLFCAVVEVAFSLDLKGSFTCNSRKLLTQFYYVVLRLGAASYLLRF